MSLNMAVIAVIGTGLFNSVAQADDGVVNARQYYVIQPGQQTQRPPNPTYWTHLKSPFGNCDPCTQQRGIYTRPAIRWLLDPNYYGVAPDYGWAPPGRSSIHRDNVTYRRFHPSVYYGQQTPKGREVKRYPIIAQPTDTTQQGYYYQHVPVWGGAPKGMLPPAPHPHTWHYRPCALTPEGYYVKRVPIRRVLVPINQIPVIKDAQGNGGGEKGPGPVAVPIPKIVPVPAPVPAAKRVNGPEAINVPEVGNAVRRASFN